MGKYAAYLAAHGKERPGILFFLEHLDTLEEFTDEEAGQLLKATLRYGKSGEITEFKERGMKILFRRIREQIDVGAEKWEEDAMRSLYGPYKREAQKKGDFLKFDDWAARELRDFACKDSDPQESDPQEIDPFDIFVGG